MTSIASISVVIPCYNSEKTLPVTLASVLGQALLPAEIICVDDGSSDATVAVLERHRLDFPDGVSFRVIRQPRNAGAAAARNVGMDAATQAFIAFLDADDVWHERKLEIQHRWMLENPTVDLSGHTLCWFKGPDAVESFRVSAVTAAFPVRRISVFDMLVSNRFPTPSVMLKRSLPLRFSEDLEVAEDYEMWTRIVMEGHEACLFEISLMSLQKAPYGEAGLTQDLSLMIKNQMLMLRKFRERGKISLLSYGLLCLFFQARHYRRVLKVSLGGLSSSPAGH